MSALQQGPYQKTFLDRLADVMLGADPSTTGGAPNAAEQRYALICHICFNHNGLCHRDQWDALRADGSLLPCAIEEMLRWTSPVKNMCRMLTADTEFHGTELKQGEKIMLLFESANFDESVFDNANQFDIRRDPNSHVAFGFGTHFCLGNQLARMELRLMTERVLQRLPDLRLASDDAGLPLRPANFVSGFESMPMVFTPTKPILA